MNFRSYPEITEQSSFEEIDEALYQFERPLYAYCASGANCNPSTNYPGWDEERARLKALWYAKRSYISKEVQPTSFLSKVFALFK